jgi:hypothetical protein
MTALAQASDGGTWFFLALAIAIGLVALAAWVTHWIWFFRSFGFVMWIGQVKAPIGARYLLGVAGLAIPIVGIIHGLAIWAGVGARVGG